MQTGVVGVRLSPQGRSLLSVAPPSMLLLSSQQAGTWPSFLQIVPESPSADAGPTRLGVKAGAKEARVLQGGVS